jgi:tRNA A37 N6-isopentenylltransferase MiaA
MIDDDKVHDALEYLRTNAPKAAQAKANRIYAEEYRKTVKAQEMAKLSGIPVTAQEREAYRSDVYIKHLDAIKEAVYEDELNRWGMVAATSIIEAWRTQNANRRGEGKIG